MSAPMLIELFAGLHGWGEGAVAEGYRVVGFDLFDMCRETGIPPPEGDIQLVLQDVLTLHGSQFRDAALICASPPCQEFSYMAMPWTRAKEKAAKLREDAEDRKRLTALFDACFRIQREASEAAGRYIPMVVENVRGAQPWVGRSRWNYGSFHLYGDVPALMPMTKKLAKVPGFRFDGSGKSFQSAAVTESGVKVPGMNWSDRSRPAQGFNVEAEKRLRDGTKNGNDWFGAGEACSEQRRHGSKSIGRKAASAMIARIPFALARHIAASWKPK